MIGDSPARRRARLWRLPGAALVAAVLAALAGCGPDIGPGAASEASSAPSAGASVASAAISSSAPASPAPTSSAPASSAPASGGPVSLAAAGPACPAIVQPKCPAATPASATPSSKASRRMWARHRGGRYRHHWRKEQPTVERYAEARGMEMHEESSESDRVIVRRHACPGACPGARRDWDFAGIDARGYLVWPGKVEY